MIEVKFFFQKEKILGFEISGHALYAEKGEDIVCSAVSVLAQTAILGLVEFLKEESYYYSIKDDGYLICKLKENPDNIDYEKSQVILKTIYLGMKSIEEEYSKYVKIFKEV